MYIFITIIKLIQKYVKNTMKNSDYTVIYNGTPTHTHTYPHTRTHTHTHRIIG